MKRLLLLSVLFLALLAALVLIIPRFISHTEELVFEPPVEVPAAEEEAPAVDERDQRIADLEAEIARLEEENGALRERIAELEGEPAAKPAAEEFKKTEEKNSKVAKMEKRGYRF